MNPYDLTGPSFLGLLSTAWVISVMTAAAVKKSMQDSYPCETPIDTEFSPYEIAYLSGRENAAIQAAVANLFQTGVLTASNDGQNFVIDNAKTADPDHFVLAVKSRLTQNQAYSLGAATQSIKVELTEIFSTIHNKLLLKKLLFDTETAVQISMTAMVIAELPALAAVPKLLIGLQHSKPIGFLIVEMIFISVIALAFAITRPYRTKSGDAVLEKYRFNESSLKTAAGSKVCPMLSGKEAAMAVALFSTAVFASGPLYDNRRAMAASGGGSCGSSSGCGSGSCGGGGCGGGCGGCGG